MTQSLIFRTDFDATSLTHLPNLELKISNFNHHSYYWTIKRKPTTLSVPCTNKSRTFVNQTTHHI